MFKGTSFLATANTNTGDQSGLEVLLLEPNGYKGTEWLKISLQQSGLVALQVTRQKQ